VDESTKLGFLRDEYVLLQKLYEDFDARALTIKGWSATIGIAAIGVGFYQSAYLWLFAAGAALAFWNLEALWKTFQYCYSERIKELEEVFRSGRTVDVSPFQVYGSWIRSWQRIHVYKQFWNGLVALPHVVTFVVGLALFLLETLAHAGLVSTH
jgi:hypothetical protein